MVEMFGAGRDISMGRSGSDFQNLNRNKRSIQLDLKSDEGRAIFHRLATDADVVIENFRPDVKARLGIDYETLRALNPGLVYGSISGFGEDGPYRMRPGFDQVAQGMGGLMSVTGLPGQGPVRAGIAVADSCGRAVLRAGVLTALLDREVTGVGRWVQTSLLQAQIAMLDFQAARWLVEGEVAGQEGNNHPTAVPMGAVRGRRRARQHRRRRRRDVREPLPGRRRRGAAGRRALRHRPGPPRQQGRAQRRARRRSCARRTVAEWVDDLNAAGIPCGPVYAIDEVFADPQVEHLGMARTVHDDEQGDITLVGQGFALHDVEPTYARRAPAAGQHTEQVLLDLGYSPDEIAGFRDRGVIPPA